jgi:hypothetical protein
MIEGWVYTAESVIYILEEELSARLEEMVLITS